MSANIEYQKCEYCGAEPSVPGPHHNCIKHSGFLGEAFKNLPHLRCRKYLDLYTNEALGIPCKHCGKSPFFIGMHHERDCPKWSTITTRIVNIGGTREMGTDEHNEFMKRAEKNMDSWMKDIKDRDWWGGGD